MANIKLSLARELKSEFDSDWREIAENMISDDEDFTVGRYRFINTDSIDEIYADELENDPETSGACAAWCIAEATEWPEAVIEAAQNGGGEAAIIESMTRDQLITLAESLSGYESYGPHFARYDGEEMQFGNWYAFRIR